MKKFMIIFLSLIICFTIPQTVFSFDIDKLDKVYEDVGNYLFNTVKNPGVGSVGGEWTILGLARSDINIPDDYFKNYYKNSEEYVKENKGVLHNKKYTEYSRVIVALTSIGKNPKDVSGYNLLTPLGDYEKTIWQGINGAIWALIALDCGEYDIPINSNAKVQATREMYLNYILENEIEDGGWALSGSIAEPDVTGMALCALSRYQDNIRVKSAIDRAVKRMSEVQDDKGGFSNFGSPNSESCVQMIVALCELGISVYDASFVKNGYTILDNLMNYYNESDGFTHDKDGENLNLMATEQAFYGIVALKRAMKQKNTLYNMQDVISVVEYEDTGTGLENKNPDIKTPDIINNKKFFSDVANHKDKTAIEELASRGIINGRAENIFEPDSTMSRAEFATIITKGLGLYKKSNDVFKDVVSGNWFYDYVGTAYSYGIIKGVSESEFNPDGIITREEASVMITRVASICGIDTKMDSLMVRDVLSQFFDYVKASDWAQSSLAFCYREKILDDSVMYIKPKEAVTRAEIAAVLCNLLTLSKLI